MKPQKQKCKEIYKVVSLKFHWKKYLALLMYVELFGGSVVWFWGIFLEQPKLQLSNYLVVFLLMITENGFGIRGFLSKGC